jgi:serine/threonine-protein kinase
VYKCRRSSGDRAYIAIKQFSSRAARDAATSPRAQEEFALARRLLTHDCIVRVFALDLAKGCLAMEFVDGGSLEDVMAREGPLREERIIRVLSQVLEALALLHAHGCPHRDVKPANVLVETHSDTFKLSDWIGSEAEDLSLALGKPVGTPVFMSPEVAGCPHRHCFESDTVHTCTHSHSPRTHALALLWQP